MKPENNTENTAGSDCQERLVVLLRSMQERAKIARTIAEDRGDKTHVAYENGIIDAIAEVRKATNDPELIDTAPKDGTHILAYDVMSYGWKLAFFERLEGQWYGDAPTKLGNPLGVHRLTHWMPMLADPLIQRKPNPCPRCGYCGFVEDAAMTLAGVCPECNGAGRDILQHNVERMHHYQRGRTSITG